jgi:hypothetical protein
MITDPFHPEEALIQEKESTRRRLLAVVCAVGVTALLLAGYGYMRRHHAQQVLANAPVQAVGDSGPKGPPLAHIVIDEPSLEKGITTIGGVVKNISGRELTGLSIALELYRRKDGVAEQKSIPVNPATLQPEQEGAYSLDLSASSYASIKLVGLKADPESELIVFSSSGGKKRSPERLEPRTVVVKRPGRSGEFLNTPDNPTRVP